VSVEEKRVKEMKLTSENVEFVFNECKFDSKTSKEKAIQVDGVVHIYSFDQSKLNKRKKDIYSMLRQLPDEFQQDGGGGMSFLKACDDKNGNRWTDLHLRIEQLLCLGIATDQLDFCLPREAWHIMPGGMPYVVVLGDKK